jgi:hypothetical protein
MNSSTSSNLTALARGVTMVVLYYENPKMLAYQVECWNEYQKELSFTPTICIVDDGSSNFPAYNVLKELRKCFHLRLYQILVDIPWNFSGARNLGCLDADGWIYTTDIDAVLEPKDARILFEGMPLRSKEFHVPSRIAFQDSSRLPPTVTSVLVHKIALLRAGGWDEDYAGYYGKEDSDFYLRLLKVARRIRRDDATVRMVTPRMIKDARTRNLNRDKARNCALFESRKRAGFPAPARPLRFPWKRLI